MVVREREQAPLRDERIAPRLEREVDPEVAGRHRLAGGGAGGRRDREHEREKGRNGASDHAERHNPRRAPVSM
jgi:hypothetical protein